MKKLLACLIAIFLLTVVLAVNYRPLFTSYAGLFSVHNASPGADALVVLGGRITSRIPYALSLYKRGYAPKILLTDVRPDNYNLGVPGLDFSERAIATAVRDHFHPEAALEIVPSRSGQGAASTFDEAWDLLHYCRRTGCGRLILITDDFHTRRALYAFCKVFEDSGVRIEVMGAPNGVFSEHDWWKSDAGLKAYLLEPMLFLVYLLTDANVAFLENK